MVSRRFFFAALLPALVLIAHMSGTTPTIAQTGGWTSWSYAIDLDQPVPDGWMFGEDAISVSENLNYPYWLTWGGTYLDHTSTNVADGTYGYESCDGVHFYTAYSGWGGTGAADYTGGSANNTTAYYPPAFEAWEEPCGTPYGSCDEGYDVWDLIYSVHTEELSASYWGVAKGWGPFVYYYYGGPCP